MRDSFSALARRYVVAVGNKKYLYEHKWKVLGSRHETHVKSATKTQNPNITIKIGLEFRFCQFIKKK